MFMSMFLMLPRFFFFSSSFLRFASRGPLNLPPLVSSSASSSKISLRIRGSVNQIKSFKAALHAKSIYISCPTHVFTVPAIFNVLAVIVDDEALLDAALYPLRVLFLVDDVVNSILLFHLI